MSNSFFDRKIETEDLILRFMVLLAIACYIVWRDLIFPLLPLALRSSSVRTAVLRESISLEEVEELAKVLAESHDSTDSPGATRVMRLPTEERIDLDTLCELQDQASNLNIEFDEDTTIRELEEAVTEALAERKYGHPSLTPAQRNRPNAKGFL